MRLGRIHCQFQIVEAQGGDICQLVGNRFDRKVHGSVLHGSALLFG